MGPIFELQLSNLVRIHNFVSCKSAENFVTKSQVVNKNQFECSVHILRHSCLDWYTVDKYTPVSLQLFYSFWSA